MVGFIARVVVYSIVVTSIVGGLAVVIDGVVSRRNLFVDGVIVVGVLLINEVSIVGVEVSMVVAGDEFSGRSIYDVSLWE